jgi:hypothetical protein
VLCIRAGMGERGIAIWPDTARFRGRTSPLENTEIAISLGMNRGTASPPANNSSPARLRRRRREIISLTPNPVANPMTKLLKSSTSTIDMRQLLNV